MLLSAGVEDDIVGIKRDKFGYKEISRDMVSNWNPIEVFNFSIPVEIYDAILPKMIEISDKYGISKYQHR